MSTKKAPRSRAELDRLYHAFNKQEWRASDPIGRIDTLLAPADFELVSFIVAGLSYGRVLQIQASCDVFFRCLHSLGVGPSGEGLAEFLGNVNPADESRLSEAFARWKHRMNTAEDMVALLLRLATILQSHGSLGKMFQRCHVDDASVHISRFAETIASPVEQRKRRPTGPWTGTGLGWFASSPSSGGTCKRLMMWLRWMIRQDNIDPGLWRDGPLIDPSLAPVDPARLFWPVDTHIFQWASAQRITHYASPSWKTVIEITEHFRKLDPADPVKYDFAVCHSGMERSKVAGKAQAMNRTAAT